VFLDSVWKEKRGLRLFSFVIILGVFLIVSAGTVFAHGSPEVNNFTVKSPVPYVIFAGSWLVLFTIFLLTFGKGMIENNKKLFFWLMVTPVILSSLYLGGNTIYSNIVSETNGPVHWHADYQVWACGEKLDLVDPKGLSNKIGSPLHHEHNDDRIHIEGTLRSVEDVSLGIYFGLIGGELESSPGHLIYPVEGKVINYEDGDVCSNGISGKLKVYVNGKKVEDSENYIAYPVSNVPPGDCIIVLFDESDSETTELICDSWVVKGSSYDDFVRKEVRVGDRVWN